MRIGRKGFVVGLSLLLSGCGGQLLPSGGTSQNGSTSLTIAFPNPDDGTPYNPPDTTSSLTTKSNDPILENFVQQIHSPLYEGHLILQMQEANDLGFTKNLNGAAWSPLFSAALQVQARQLEVVSGKNLPDLRTFYKIDASDPDKAGAILRDLWKRNGIQFVYPKVIPPVNGIETIPDLSGRQGYLFNYTSTGGLSIDAMWEKGVTGQGVTIVDDEVDWNPDHEDIPRQPTIRTYNVISNAGYKAHGTAVLGILGALANPNYGVRGITSNATLVTALGGILQGFFDSSAGGSIHLYETGWYAANNSNIIVPPEVLPHVFAANQIATAAGVSVIEGAGNGGANLDDPNVYYPNGPNLATQDSGAIIVGASMGGDRQKASFSNCGSRVNVFAWGSGLVTPSYPGSVWEWYGTAPFNNDTSQPNLYYTNAFGGTSGSAAIIAGSAGLLQSYAKREMGGKKYLTPEKIREILMESGVTASSDGGCPIGVQPRMDVAMNLFDDLWALVKRDFPELARGEEIRGAKRQALRARGVGFVCKLNNQVDSDPSCPEMATCVLDPQYEVQYQCFQEATGRECLFDVDPPDTSWISGHYRCNSSLCLPFDSARSDYDCAAGAIWPGGLRIGKTLDFDGDQKADLVNWTKAKWQIDLSSDELGTWNIELSTTAVGGKWVWPVVEDYNSDGRADLAAYDKENGVWYIKFTNNELLRTSNIEHRTINWDWQITLPYHDELNRDVSQAKYGRPVPGDYNGDHYIDLAVARSDGIWSIDFGGPTRSDYGSFDLDVTYLTPEQLAAAPGWAYLPIPGDFIGGSGNAYRNSGAADEITYKVPDSLAEAGEVSTFLAPRFGTFINLNDYLSVPAFGGNESVPLIMNAADLSFKKSDGTWPVALYSDYILTAVAPEGIYGGLDCHPVVADFNGDNFDDRAVQCPTEFRIGLSSTQQLLTIPLGYNTSEFSLPGKPYFGSIPYTTTQRLIQWQLNSSSEPPVIPVDMVSTSQ